MLGPVRSRYYLYSNVVLLSHVGHSSRGKQEGAEMLRARMPGQRDTTRGDFSAKVERGTNASMEASTLRLAWCAFQG